MLKMTAGKEDDLLKKLSDNKNINTHAQSFSAYIKMPLIIGTGEKGDNMKCHSSFNLRSRETRCLSFSLAGLLVYLQRFLYIALEERWMDGHRRVGKGQDRSEEAKGSLCYLLVSFIHRL